MVTVQIINGNTAPSFNTTSLSVNTNEDTVLTIAIPAADGQGNFDGFSIVTNSANGSASITDIVNGNNATVTLTYTPNSDFIGTDFIRVRLLDSLGLTDFVDIAIKIIAQNDTPTFTTVANLSVLNSSASFSNTVVSNVEDGDAEVTQGLSFSIVASNASAVGASNVVISNTGVLTFEPSIAIFGVLTVTIQLIDDGLAGSIALSSTQVVMVQIINANTAPTFSTASLSSSINEDTVFNIAIAATDSEGNF